VVIGARGAGTDNTGAVLLAIGYDGSWNVTLNMQARTVRQTSAIFFFTHYVLHAVIMLQQVTGGPAIASGKLQIPNFGPGQWHTART
jgi:hypothetical protein